MPVCEVCRVDCFEPYQELAAYTLTRGGGEFIHQHIVDAYGALHGGFQGGARGKSSPIGVAFSLFGLYLAAEHGFTGRQVQLAHIALARWRKNWPALDFKPGRASVTVIDVMGAAPGEERDRMIREWARAVWESSAPAQQWTRETWSEFVAETGGMRFGRGTR